MTQNTSYPKRSHVHVLIGLSMSMLPFQHPLNLTIRLNIFQVILKFLLLLTQYKKSGYIFSVYFIVTLLFHRLYQHFARLIIFTLFLDFYDG